MKWRITVTNKLYSPAYYQGVEIDAVDGNAALARFNSEYPEVIDTPTSPYVVQVGAYCQVCGKYCRKSYGLCSVKCSRNFLRS